jgi:uncharacterized SAM-binding protein YcdF (DUF218 family)
MSREKIRRWLWVILLLLLAGSAWVFYDFSRFAGACSEYAKLARQGARLGGRPVEPGEAIVVLTGAPGRIARALELLRLRGSPLLIISGLGRGATLTTLVNRQGDSAVDIHKVWKKIVTESNSGSTIENAQESGKILLARGVTRVILVTSEYHMPRALRIFRIVMPKMEFIPYPTPSVVSELSNGLTHSSFEGWIKIWIEYWKYVVFRVAAMQHLQPIQK